MPSAPGSTGRAAHGAPPKRWACCSSVPAQGVFGGSAHLLRRPGRVPHDPDRDLLHPGSTPQAVLDRVLQIRAERAARGGDRKSTRLNSSHVAISYAVFCLKKKRTST